MKLSAIASRGMRKDFVDMHHLITHFRPLEAYLELYTKKYATHDVGHVVRSLVYFADADAEPDIEMRHPLDWPRLKADFGKWVNALKMT